MDTDHILAAIDAAFGQIPRPAVMLRDPNHCDECTEHEATMQAVTPQTVSLAEIGNPGWDPVCFITDEAFCYFMPGFTRMVLSETEADYLDQLLFHLDQGFRIDAFNPEQGRAVSQLIDHIAETRLDQVIDWMLDTELARVMDRLAELSQMGGKNSES